MNVGEMQRKLSLGAEQDKSLRFYDLYHLLYDRDWLRLAHAHVAQNAGSITAGCDGIDMGLFDANLEENLATLRADLQAQTFEPSPVRRVYIPKPNGKVRPLGIPSIRDRIVQEALRMIVEPIYEADFSQASFGFRPNRSTLDAIRCIHWATQERMKFRWIIEGDIASYFDTIHHRTLLRILRRRLADKCLLTIIWKFLRAGVMEKKLFRATTQGTPQGGIVSPLLANVYLHELDTYMESWTQRPAWEKTTRRQKGNGNLIYVRYADDFVVLWNGRKQGAEDLKVHLRQFLQEQLQLVLSDEKTRVTHLNDGFEFLGYRIQRQMGHRGRATKLLIPQSAMDRVRLKLRWATSPSQHLHSVNAKIMALNQIIAGWCAYYQYTSRASTIFARIDPAAFWYFAHWLGRKYRCSIPEVLKRFGSPRLKTPEKELIRGAERFPTKRYRKRFRKPNPYTTQEVRVREDLPRDQRWLGHERRPGMADLRPYILDRDDYHCLQCGAQVTPATAEVDHIRPVRRFKRPIEANTPGNLQTLCIPCHRKKTRGDLQRESLVR
jgi:RNA-directed DNA polymerase